MKTKEQVLHTLKHRAEDALIDNDISRYQRLQKAIEMISETDLPDYDMFDDVGMKLTNEPSEHKLTEDFGTYKKTTHSKGDRTWITFEEGDG